MKKLNLEEFLARLKKGKGVSRFDFELSFKWTAEASAKLRAVVADLRSADLSSADLNSADLSSANLRSADLNSANLRSADLSFANLSFADLNSANLSFANLSFANLSFAKGEFIFNFGVKLKLVSP